MNEKIKTKIKKLHYSSNFVIKREQFLPEKKIIDKYVMKKIKFVLVTEVQ